MIKRAIKSLNQTGRVSRSAARSAARALQKSGSVVMPKKGKAVSIVISKEMTATGSASVSFHIGTAGVGLSHGSKREKRTRHSSG